MLFGFNWEKKYRKEFGLEPNSGLIEQSKDIQIEPVVQNGIDTIKNEIRKEDELKKFLKDYDSTLRDMTMKNSLVLSPKAFSEMIIFRGEVSALREVLETNRIDDIRASRVSRIFTEHLPQTIELFTKVHPSERLDGSQNDLELISTLQAFSKSLVGMRKSIWEKQSETFSSHAGFLKDFLEE